MPPYNSLKIFWDYIARRIHSQNYYIILMGYFFSHDVVYQNIPTDMFLPSIYCLTSATSPAPTPPPVLSPWARCCWRLAHEKGEGSFWTGKEVRAFCKAKIFHFDEVQFFFFPITDYAFRSCIRALHLAPHPKDFILFSPKSFIVLHISCNSLWSNFIQSIRSRL